MEDPRKEGGRWFCSTSCLLQGSPGRSKNTKRLSGPVSAVRRLIKWTLLVLGALVVVGIVGAVLIKHSNNNVTDASGATPTPPPHSNGCRDAAFTKALLPLANSELKHSHPRGHQSIAWCSRTEYAVRVVAPSKHLSETGIFLAGILSANGTYPIEVIVRIRGRITRVYHGDGTYPIGPNWPDTGLQ